MKFEPTIIQVIKYNSALRKAIREEIRTHTVDPEELINELNSKADAAQFSNRLGYGNDIPAFYRRLYHLLREVVLGETKSSASNKKLTNEDLSIFIDDALEPIFSAKLACSQNWDTIVETLFDIQEIKEILIGLEISSAEELGSYRIFIRFLQNKDKILKESGDEDIWVLLSTLINPAFEKTIREKNSISAGTNVLIPLISSITTLRSVSDKQASVNDHSQDIDMIALEILKGFVQIIIALYTSQMEQTIERLVEQNRSKLNVMIYSAFKFYNVNSYRSALEKLLLDTSVSDNDLIREYTQNINSGTARFTGETLQSFLVQYFILSGLKFPDPFLFQSSIGEAGAGEINYHAGRETRSTGDENSLGPGGFVMLETPEETSDSIIAAYRKKYGHNEVEIEDYWGKSA